MNSLVHKAEYLHPVLEPKVLESFRLKNALEVPKLFVLSYQHQCGATYLPRSESG